LAFVSRQPLSNGKYAVHNHRIDTLLDLQLIYTVSISIPFPLSTFLPSLSQDHYSTLHS